MTTEATTGEGSRPNNRPSVTPPHVASETQCIAPGVRARQAERRTRIFPCRPNALNRVILAKANYEPHDGVPRGDKSVRRRAESQWIVAARLLCHLQYPATYLSRLQRIHLPNRLELPFRAPEAATSAAPGEALDTCSRGRTGAPIISRVTTGEVESAASSMDSDLEAFSHNPTHGSFAPLAFQPSAMTNYVNQRFLSY